MEHLLINTVKYGSNPNETAQATYTTVGSLIDSLSKYDADLPIVIKTDHDMYAGVGRIEKSLEY